MSMPVGGLLNTTNSSTHPKQVIIGVVPSDKAGQVSSHISSSAGH